MNEIKLVTYQGLKLSRRSFVLVFERQYDSFLILVKEYRKPGMLLLFIHISVATPFYIATEIPVVLGEELTVNGFVAIVSSSSITVGNEAPVA